MKTAEQLLNEAYAQVTAAFHRILRRSIINGDSPQRMRSSEPEAPPGAVDRLGFEIK